MAGGSIKEDFKLESPQRNGNLGNKGVRMVLQLDMSTIKHTFYMMLATFPFFSNIDQAQWWEPVKPK